MLKRVFLAMALLRMRLPCPGGDSPFDGKWKANVVRPAPASAIRRWRLRLAITSEGKVSGSMQIQDAGESPIEWGFVKGDLITFKVKMPFNNATAHFCLPRKNRWRSASILAAARKTSLWDVW